MIDIDRWPALIYTNYRSGSTELGIQLAKNHGVKFYSEPYGRKNAEGYDVEKLADFIRSYYTEEKYIVKFMPDQLRGMKEYQQLFKGNCFKIRLQRSSELDQIVSFYIAMQTLNWRQVNPQDTYTVPIDDLVIKNSIGIVIGNNNMLKYSSVKFDLDLDYEEIKTLYPDSSTKTTQPENIEEIREAVNNHYTTIRK